MSASTEHVDPSPRPVSVRNVYSVWWPLAASWLLMGCELPLVSSVVARLPEPTLSLAAYGAVVFPLALLIEAPIIMLLAASTALSRDWASYALVRRFMWIAGGALTVLHAVVAFTPPLYDFVIGDVMGVPKEVMEQARIGLQIMTPWTLAIAYRRFQQGVLIRCGHSRAIGIGTTVRLASNALVCGIGLFLADVPGIIIGSAAVAAGVCAEAVYAGGRVHPVLRDQLKSAKPVAERLTLARFAHFYLPLMITPMFMFFAMPLAAAAMSRMPLAIASLAAWPVVSGLVFMLRSAGFGFNEVVVSMLDRPHAVDALTRFGAILGATTSAILFVIAVTPLGGIWFGSVAALREDLVPLAGTALFFAIVLPGLSALISLYQGTIVHSRRTHGVIESMVLYLATLGSVLLVGMNIGRFPGIYVAITAMVCGNTAQLLWLRFRAGRAVRDLHLRDMVADVRATADA